MKNYFLLNLLSIKSREYVFLFLTATILFLFIFVSKSYSEENIFTINNVVVSGEIDKNFSRDGYIDKAFIDSFKMLLSRILLSEDISKLNNIKLNEIKSLVNRFNIINESYKKNEYVVNLKIVYNHNKVKKILIEKNISYSEPEKISAVFYPTFFIDEELKNFSENYFYNNWIKTEINNESINFIMPIEDIDDFSKIIKMKNEIEMLNIENLVKKYNTKNYAFSLINYRNKLLSIYLKTNFNNNEVSKNMSFAINNINDETQLNLILKKLKLEIIDIWKSENIINIAIPLNMQIKFKFKKLDDLDKLKNIFYKISIVDQFSLEEFNINYSIFKIYYYGSPKKLSNELLKLGYELKNTQSHWELYKNE